MPVRFPAFLFALFLTFFNQISYCLEKTDSSFRFEQLGPFGGDVRSLLIDSERPAVAYMGSSNGKIYKSVDGGASWTPLRPGIGKGGYVVDTLVQHPLDPDHIYAGGWDLHSDGGGLFESKDAGLSWSQIQLTQDASAVRGFEVCRSDPERMITGTLTGVFVSTDGGASWNQVGGSKLYKAESVAMDPKNCRTLYVGTWRLGYRSDDFGKTWEKLQKGMPLDSDIFSIVLNRENPSTVYAGACSGVYRSVNNASLWKRLRVLSDRFTIRAHILLVDPVEARRLYAGTSEGLFVSENEGRNWRRLTGRNVSVNAVQVDPSNNSKIMIGSEYRGVLRSEDGGRSWKESNTGFVHQKISWIVSDPDREGLYILGVQSGEGGLYRYDKSSGTWNRSRVGEEGTRVISYLVLPDGRGRLAGTSQGVYWLPAGSSDWEKLGGLISERTVYSLVADSSGRFVFAGTDRGIYRTSIDTLDFKVPVHSRMSPKVWCVLAPESDPDIVYAGTSLGLLRSWDKGTTWHILSASGLPERAVIRTLAVFPSDPKHLLAATSAGLLESENGGIHWKRTKDGGLGVDIGAAVFLDGTGHAILASDNSSGGVYLSNDGGGNWKKLFSSAFDSPIFCILRDPEQPHLFWAGTQSDGVYLLSLQ